MIIIFPNLQRAGFEVTGPTDQSVENVVGPIANHMTEFGATDGGSDNVWAAAGSMAKSVVWADFPAGKTDAFYQAASSTFRSLAPEGVTLVLHGPNRQIVEEVRL